MLYKSINQWSFGGGMSPMDCLKASHEFGFAGFEPALSHDGPLSLKGWEADAKEIKAAAQDMNMQIRTLASGVYWDLPLSSDDASVRQAGMDAVRQQLDCANALGAKTILVVPGTVGTGFFGKGVAYADAYKRSQDCLRQVESHAKQAGVVIGVENVWNNFLLSPMEFAAYLDELDSPFIKAYFDVGNVVLFGESADWIYTLGSRIAAIHVKDFRRSVGTLAGFVPLLEGDVDWKAVIPALRKVGYDGPVTAEMGTVALDPCFAARQTSTALDLILAL